MRAAEESYVRKVRSLERRQNFHRFYLFHGVAVSSLLIFVAVILALKLDEHGWTRSAYTLNVDGNGELFPRSRVLRYQPVYFAEMAMPALQDRDCWLGAERTSVFQLRP